MNESLIVSWNDYVRPEDIVYYLGDFTLSGVLQAERIFCQLHGEIKVLSYPWHHDREWIKSNYKCTSVGRNGRKHTVEKLGQIEVLPDLAGPRLPIVLCHYPFAPGRWDRAHFFSYHLHGHNHGNYDGPGLSLDVGVDKAYLLTGEYRPFSLPEIQEIMRIKSTK